ncbi:MAG: hypothetical protein OEY14_18540 [Myxococcales bacterium]|nr:hypothetical protein [Myxococcales bacterium]
MKLPESLHFLAPGWWVIHVASLGLVFAAGFLASHHLAGHDPHAHGGEAPPADHHGSGHQDHTAPEVLRPLMQQMLVDSVQLQGALSEGDLGRATTHADAIAGACGDEEAGHGALPDRLGPSFVERDRALHGSASRLGAALRAGRQDEARSLNREMVSACQACHVQAPAARDVDMSALLSFTDVLASPDAGM